MTDIYQPYRDMLAGRDVLIQADNPYPGRYKIKRGDVFLPVAIGPDEFGTITALVDGVTTNPMEIWTHCAKRPVSQSDYKFRKENGHWPDEPKPTIRSNMPSDPLEALMAEIEDKSKLADELLTKHAEIRSQDTCNLFRNLQAQLLALNKKADGLFDAEKRPLLEAARACDEKFRFRAAVIVISTRLRQRFEAFLKAEERRQQAEADAKFKAERAAVEAERQRIEAEQAKRMRDDPVAALTSDAPEMPELPLAPEQVKVTAGGGFGRKAGLKTKRRVQIVDLDAVFSHFKGREEVHVLLDKLANASLRAGVDVPGTKIVEERVAA